MSIHDLQTPQTKMREIRLYHPSQKADHGKKDDQRLIMECMPPLSCIRAIILLDDAF